MGVPQPMHVECGACNKVYSSKHCLRKHHQRQPLCAKWLTMSPALTSYVNDTLMLPRDSGHDDLRCGICGTTFANKGNLNRHLDQTLICSKWAVYMEAERLLPYVDLKLGRPLDLDDSDATGRYATFVAPERSCWHIIWNVYLVDKDLANSLDMDAIVTKNNIKYVVALLPNESEYPESLKSVDHVVMTYEGHTPVLDTAAFDTQCRAIEAYRHKRDNVLVFCNKGYQRSIPFLTYYLTRFHGDEVPTVERAIDLILPQVDKANYTHVRDGCIRDVSRLLHTHDVSAATT